MRNNCIASARGIAKKSVQKEGFTTQKIVITGVMAALSFVAYEFFRIPNVFGTGASFHLGNTFTALTALLLDGVCGGFAGAIGLSMADIIAGDPGYAVSTFLLKFIIGIVCGLFAHKVFRLKDLSPRSTPHGKYVAAVAGSAASGLFLNVLTDPVIGYFRDRYIFGMPVEFVKYAVKIAGGVTFVNSVLSTICVVVIYLAVRPALESSGLLRHGE